MADNKIESSELITQKESNYNYLVDNIRAYIGEVKEMGLQGNLQKIAVITKRPKVEGTKDTDYEEWFARILLEAKDGGDILEWYPTRPSSPLDEQQVDFLVCIKEGEVIPFQVTSSVRKYQERVSKIKHKYPLKVDGMDPIAIVGLRQANGDKVSDQVARRLLLAKMKTTKPIKV